MCAPQSFVLLTRSREAKQCQVMIGCCIGAAAVIEAFQAPWRLDITMNCLSDCACMPVPHCHLCDRVVKLSDAKERGAGALFARTLPLVLEASKSRLLNTRT